MGDYDQLAAPGLAHLRFEKGSRSQMTSQGMMHVVAPANVTPLIWT